MTSTTTQTKPKILDENLKKNKDFLSTAKLNYLRIAPRKVRLVADLIRGKKVEDAQVVLNFTIKKATLPLLKLLKQAVANAKNSFQIDSSNLYISKIVVDEGPKLKRWRPRARGRAFKIQKKTSHIILTLDALIGKKLKKIKAKKVEKTEEIKKIIKKERPKSLVGREIFKPKIERGVKRIFKRKAF